MSSLLSGSGLCHFQSQIVLWSSILHDLQIEDFDENVKKKRKYDDK
jgi:hypothetical protein